jgi:hypothetical protein
MQSDLRGLDPFQSAAGWLAAIGCLAATVAVPLATDVTAFRGSIATSGLVALVFAVQNLRLLVTTNRPHLPPAAITTVFGLWFVAAPLLYTEPGLLPTAILQFCGLLVAAFAGYLTLEALGAESRRSHSR